MRTTIMLIAAGTAMLAACGGEVGCPGGRHPQSGKCTSEETSESTPSQLDAQAPADDGSSRPDAPSDGGAPGERLADSSSSPSGQDAGACSPGAEDLVDDLGFDANCDGVDGVREEHLFVTTSGDDEAAGSENFPLRTIAKALARASSEGRKGVLLAAGTYEECNLNLSVSSVRLFGGYLPKGANWNARDIAAPSVIRTSNAGVRIAGISSESVIEAVSIEAASADEPEFCAPASPEQPSGRSSVGLTVSSSERTLPSMVLRHAEVFAGAAGSGAPGNAGEDGDARVGDAAGAGIAGCPGGPGCPQLTGQQEYRTTAAPDRPRCEINARLNGGAGGASRWYGESGGGSGTAGGPVGYPPGNGVSGTSGKPGSHGAGGTSQGTFSIDGYSPKIATAGVRGQVGEGGGGGGGADSARVTACPAGSSPSPSTPAPSSGGSGGTGGCGGHGGAGAQGGGASIGLIADGLTLVLKSTRVEASSGGRGGRGGRSGRSGLGGTGGRGGNSACGDWDGKKWVSTAGGRGGDGGAGGEGGYGGGGMGGPSVGVLVLGRAQIEAPDGSIVAGKAGLSGPSGGSPGALGTSQILLKQN